MKDCHDCIWYGKEKPDQCGNYLCRNQSEYDPRFGIEGGREEEAVSDYIKRADVLELVMRGNLVSNRNYKSVMRLIMGIPAADVRPVVLCRDCKHSDTFAPDCTEATFPLKCLSIRYGGVYPNWFCEHGEMREES